MTPYQITSAKITSKTIVMICSPTGIGFLSMTARASVRGSGMLQRAVGSSAQQARLSGDMENCLPRIASLKMLPDNFPVMSGAELPNQFGDGYGKKDQHARKARDHISAGRALSGERAA